MAKRASAFTPPPEDEAEMVQAPASATARLAAQPAAVAQEAVAPVQPATGSKPLPSYRIGRRNLSAWIDEKAFNQFKAMVSEDGKTIQDYVIEMVNREFARKGRPQIAK